MARRVLLIDPDVDALGELAALLRVRGFTVVLADSTERGIARAHEEMPDVVFGASAVCYRGGLVDQWRADPALEDTPLMILIAEGEEGFLPEQCLLRTNIDALVGKLVSFPLRTVVAAETTHGEIRGDLSQVPLIDLLQILSTNRRTGVLSVATAAGEGEVRMTDGDVVDAVYRRLDGEKALYRLLGEREGNFMFVPGGSAALRRVNVSTPMLVMEAMRQLDEVARRKAELAPGGDALIADHPPEADAPRLEREIVLFLQVPRSIEETLDEIQAPDANVLETLQRIEKKGLLRLIPRAALRTQLANEERMQMLRALVMRLARDGFHPPPRIVIAASPQRLASLARAMLRIEDSVAPPVAPPSAPVPHLMATLRFGDAVELAVVALPVVKEFAPLWSLTLPGTAAVVRLDGGDSPDLEVACSAAEIPVVHAAALLGEVEEGDPTQVAALVRTTLETVAGT